MQKLIDKFANQLLGPPIFHLQIVHIFSLDTVVYSVYLMLDSHEVRNDLLCLEVHDDVVAIPMKT